MHTRNHKDGSQKVPNISKHTHTRKYIDIYCQMMNIQLYSNYALSHPHLAAQTIRPQARQWPMALALLTEAQEQRKANSPMLRRCALLPRFSCVSMWYQGRCWQFLCHRPQGIDCLPLVICRDTDANWFSCRWKLQHVLELIMTCHDWIWKDLNMIHLSRFIPIFSWQLSRPWIAQFTTSLSPGYCYNAAISACEKGQAEDVSERHVSHKGLQTEGNMKE